MYSIEWWLIVSSAFAGSFGHCVGMCGGFIVAYSSTKIDASMGKGEQLIRHSAYNIGRVSSYVILGMIFGGIGALVSLSLEMHGALFIFAGIIMIITALGMFGLSIFIIILERGFSSNPLFKSLFSRLIKSKSIGR